MGGWTSATIARAAYPPPRRREIPDSVKVGLAVLTVLNLAGVGAKLFQVLRRPRVERPRHKPLPQVMTAVRGPLPVLDGRFCPVLDDGGGRQARQVTPQTLWSGLDDAWQEAFRQAWEALRTGNIAVGACATTRAGLVVHAARNRVVDSQAPVGQVFNSSLAHAEVNVIAQLSLDQPTELVLTTTLEPCLQCSAVIRLGPIATVRFAGADPLWEGCHDFSPLSGREAGRTQVEMIGPRRDELGAFGTLISRFWRHGPEVLDFLRARGEAETLELVQELESSGTMASLAAMEVDQAFAYLWPRLRALRGA